MFCPHCGHVLPQDSVTPFCPYCGNSLEGREEEINAARDHARESKKKRRKKLAAVLAYVLAGLVFAGMAAAIVVLASGRNGRAVPKQASAVSINPAENTGCIYPGDTIKLNAEFYPADAEPEKIVWSSSDAAVAEVDSTGNVRFLKNGEAVITAALDNGV